MTESKSKATLQLVMATIILLISTVTITRGTRCSDNSGLDVVFVIDTSGSIGMANFQSIRQFIANITTKLFHNRISPAVGVITFNNSARLYFNLQAHADLSTLLSAIENIPYHGGTTNTAAALRLLLSTAQDGTLGLRNDSSKIAIVITDGDSTYPNATSSAATTLHASNIFDVNAVGIAGANRPELRRIANNSEFVFFANSFNSTDLQQLQETILPELCIIQAEIIDEVENVTNPVTFHCRATGNPTPNISWYFNTRLLTNALDETQPYINVPMDNITTVINEGDNINFTCEARGSPTPTVIWSRTNDDIVSMSNNATTRSGSVFANLLITNVSREDTGVYTCTANNSLGIDSINVRIIILSQPYINVPMDNITTVINEGDNINFTCEATGSPTPTVIWSRTNGDIVSMSNNATTRSGSVFANLIITNASREDTGVYTCNANNSLGIDSINVRIIYAPISNNTDGSSDNDAIVGGIIMGGIILLLMIIVFCIIVILCRRRCLKTEVFHVYEEIYYNAAKLNTGVTVKHRQSYDVAKDETADFFVKMDTNPSYGVSIGEDRVKAFSMTATCTADSDTKAHQSLQKHHYDNVYDNSSQLHHNTATNTSGDEKEDNIQIHTTVDKKHNTEKMHSPHIFSVANSDKPTDEGEYGIINQPQCDDPDFDITVDQVIASSIKLSKYSIIDQPQCNNPSFDTTVDQSHATKSCLAPRFTDEDEYGIINQPQCDDHNFGITVHTTEPPVIAKLTDEGKYGIINQPQCNDPNFHITVDQSPTKKSCLPLIANNADEGECGVINQPQCDNADEGEYGVINQPQCDNADEGEYGVINQPQCDDLI